MGNNMGILVGAVREEHRNILVILQESSENALGIPWGYCGNTV